MSDSAQLLANAVLVLVPMVLSLTVHEFAHAFAARKLGDTTAEGEGRLTLNPLTHADPMGTFMLPLFLLLTQSPVFFGWAKPVPFNPSRFNKTVNMRTGTTIVAAAGPGSNFLLAVICQGVWAVLYKMELLATMPFLHQLLSMMVAINVALCVFNLIPIHPLDGQKVLSGFLPYDKAINFERFSERYGMFLLIGVILLANQTGLISVPIQLMMRGIRAVFGFV